MKNYNWEYFKSQVNQKFSEPETKKIYSQRKIDVYSLIRNVYVPDALYVLGCKILCFMKFNHSHISIIKISLQIY